MIGVTDPLHDPLQDKKACDATNPPAISKVVSVPEGGYLDHIDLPSERILKGSQKSAAVFAELMVYVLVGCGTIDG